MMVIVCHLTLLPCRATRMQTWILTMVGDSPQRKQTWMEPGIIIVLLREMQAGGIITVPIVSLPRYQFIGAHGILHLFTSKYGQ